MIISHTEIISHEWELIRIHLSIKKIIFLKYKSYSINDAGTLLHKKKKQTKKNKRWIWQGENKHRHIE